MRKAKEITCQGCAKIFWCPEKDQKFCTRSCAASNRTNIHSQETKEKISAALSKYYEIHSSKEEKQKYYEVGVATRRGRPRKTPNNLFELSKRTICKIVRRLKIGCSNCGWNEWIGDIHHISGRQIPDPHNHANLCYLCPNCHRLAHAGVIPKTSLINLDSYIGDTWKQYYADGTKE